MLIQLLLVKLALIQIQLIKQALKKTTKSTKKQERILHVNVSKIFFFYSETEQTNIRAP